LTVAFEPFNLTAYFLPFNVTVYSPLSLVLEFVLFAVLLTDTVPLPSKNSIPLSTLPSLQAAEIKIFSSVVSRPASIKRF